MQVIRAWLPARSRPSARVTGWKPRAGGAVLISQGRKRTGWRWGRGRKSQEKRSPQQLELLLNGVRPVRNTLLDDDVEMVRRGKTTVIFETQPAELKAQARLEEESDRTWARLRGRRLNRMEVRTD
jgi:hypothetical protein